MSFEIVEVEEIVSQKSDFSEHCSNYDDDLDQDELSRNENDLFRSVPTDYQFAFNTAITCGFCSNCCDCLAKYRLTSILNKWKTTRHMCRTVL